jgi:hypothetical protein
MQPREELTARKKSCGSITTAGAGGVAASEQLSLLKAEGRKGLVLMEIGVSLAL